MPVDFKFNHAMIKVKKWILGGIGLHLNTVNPSTTEAVVQRCSVKKVFLKISQNSQENICARISF